MNRKAFQQVSRLRVKEARSLLREGHAPGAFYLIGYAVECALKACVSKQVSRHDIPEKKFVIKVYTHNLEQLVDLAGLKHDFKLALQTNKTLEVNWTTVKDWSTSSRYDGGITIAQAKDMYSACTSRKNGILMWIKSKW